MQTCPTRLFQCICTLLLISTISQAQPQWIWHQDMEANPEKVYFEKTVHIEADVLRTMLMVATSGSWEVFVNDQLVANGTDWKVPTFNPLSNYLVTGKNTIRVACNNTNDVAGFIASLTIEYYDKKPVKIFSDSSWRVKIAGIAGDTKARKVFNYGQGPWGKVFEKTNHRSQPQTGASNQKTLPGFNMEKIYEVDKQTKGSWVGMTVDDRGRLITCDQYGHFYRVDVKGDVSVEQLNIALVGAHGVLYAFDSLYIVINEHKDKEKRGIYRLQDTTGDDQFDQVTLIKKIYAGGEHGIHSLVVAPDGQSIYFAAGNHSVLPDDIRISGSGHWQEDLITKRLFAPNGHATGIRAPGGFVLRFNPDGSDMVMIAHGFRNQFDLAFDQRGELFTFDADMELDFGTPWYRPTRVNHVVSGAEFGWRTGSGKWPAYYPDALPAVLDIGPGCPTGVVSGKGAKFPKKYQKALFINDWTFGTMYAVHLKPDGASYTATHEEFLSGRGLPLTDVIIHPQDGNMYFMVGGRRTQSALYRVRYIGNEKTTPVKWDIPVNKLTQKRRRLEQLQAQDVGVKAIKKAWPALNHPDRHIRYAARVAIEKQPVNMWQDKALSEKRPAASIEALIALTRMGDATLQSKIIDAAGKLNFKKMKPDRFLAAVRLLQLCVARMGLPTKADCDTIIKTVASFYPNQNNLINRELSQLLLSIGYEKATSITVNLMLNAVNETTLIASDDLINRNAYYAQAVTQFNKSRPNTQQIALAYSLYNIKTGWSPELRKAFFSWFPIAGQWRSNTDLSRFIEKMRQDALQLVTNSDERSKLDTFSMTPPKVMADIIPAVGPPVIWTVDSAMKALENKMVGRDFAMGKNLYRAQMCFSCHAFKDGGGGIGPILTQAGNRYTLHDLLENIIEPSKVISDQFGSIVVTKHDGTALVGRSAGKKDGALMLMTNPNTPDNKTAIALDDIKSEAPYPVSAMPPGLIYPLNADELADLVAYILSGGNPDDAMFSGGDTVLFDGKTLTGWRGDRELWSVVDGAIYGTTHHKKLKQNTFLVCDTPAGDFHLTYEAKVVGNNSGMQYRSSYIDEATWRLKGYQADIHPKHEYIAMLYGEGLGRGIVAKRGEKVIVNNDGSKPEVVGNTDPVTELDIAQWHTYEVICKGNHIIHKVDGTVAIDLVDDHKDKLSYGKFGIQLHKGKDMACWFRNITLKQ